MPAPVPLSPLTLTLSPLGRGDALAPPRLLPSRLREGPGEGGTGDRRCLSVSDRSVISPASSPSWSASADHDGRERTKRFQRQQTRSKPHSSGTKPGMTAMGERAARCRHRPTLPTRFCPGSGHWDCPRINVFVGQARKWPKTRAADRWQDDQAGVNVLGGDQGTKIARIRRDQYEVVFDASGEDFVVGRPEASNVARMGNGMCALGIERPADRRRQALVDKQSHALFWPPVRPRCARACRRGDPAAGGFWRRVRRRRRPRAGLPDSRRRGRPRPRRPASARGSHRPLAGFPR